MFRLRILFVMAFLLVCGWSTVRAQEETPPLPAVGAVPTAGMTETTELTRTAQPTVQAGWIAPQPGQALQGRVRLQANIPAGEVSVLDLAFRYQDSQLPTWFSLPESEGELPAGALAVWDTTMISDGNYDLRLRLTFADGQSAEYLVRSLRVRNYTPIETATPTPVTPTATTVPGDTPLPTETVTPTITPLPGTVTPFPTNPAVLSSGQIGLGVGSGALFGLAVVGLVSLLQSWRAARRRSDD